MRRNTTAIPKYWFVVDFDGTAATKDVQVAILDRFCTVDWRSIEEEILSQGDKSYKYLPAIYAHWSTPQSVVEEFVKTEMELDPNFPAFVSWCRDHDYPVEIVSDGLELYIKILLKRHNLDIPYRSNRITLTAQGATLEFPYHTSDCGKCANCKRSRVLEIKADPSVCVVYIGDGISDECPARYADLLFAKGHLAEYCCEQGIDHIAFQDFGDILEWLPKLALPGKVSEERKKINCSTL